MNPWLLIIFGLSSAITSFWVLWRYQKRTGDYSIVDVAWGTGVGTLGAAFCLLSFDGNAMRRVCVGVLALAWAIRLSYYVYERVKNLPEDGRYTEMQEKWGEQADAKMLRFYMFQAIASVLFAVPMLIAAQNQTPFGALDGVAICLWIIAIGGESISDGQLHRFRKNPNNKGKVCKHGMWKYSRHPNYFFEWLHWWSYVLFAISGSWGWLSIFAPLLMLFFILRVTGIPPTEAQAIKSRGEAYREYQRTTSAFFPWFPIQVQEQSKS